MAFFSKTSKFKISVLEEKLVTLSSYYWLSQGGTFVGFICFMFVATQFSNVLILTLLCPIILFSEGNRVATCLEKNC